MPCVKLCLQLQNPPRRVCFRIQCRRLGLKVPDLGPYFSDPAVFEVDGKQPAWLGDVNAIAVAARASDSASPAVRKVLTDGVARAVEQLSGKLPQGVELELG